MKKVSIVEVGPRDGLQNEQTLMKTKTKLELIKRLERAGLRRIEVGAFVSPKWVPQMADSDKVVRGLKKSDKYSVLVPNLFGMEKAIELEVKEVAVFAAASETFSKKNINCTIAESFERFEPVVQLAKKHKIKVRGYLSTCFYCPYEGKIKESQVVKVIKMMRDLGVYEISVGDTIGAATPNEVRSLIKRIKKIIHLKKIAMHFHDTRGTALANITVSLEEGIRTFDSSIGGLGGCPYAPGAAGNVATEDVVFLCERMGYQTGANLPLLIKINEWLSRYMERELPSRVSKSKLLKI